MAHGGTGSVLGGIGLYMVALGQYWVVLVGTWWYWVTRRWRVFDRMSPVFTTTEYRATQLVSSLKFKLNHAICDSINTDQIASPFVIDPKKLKEKDVDTIIVEVNNMECELKLLCKYIYCCSLQQWWKEEKVLLALRKR